MRRINLAVLLLVVLLVAVLGVTIVYRVREAGKRINCQNGLYGVGLGLKGYHDAMGHFPSATVRNPGLPPEKRVGWITEIWPAYMCGGAKALIDKTKPWDAEENYPPRLWFRGERGLKIGELEWFRCPARGSETSDATTGYRPSWPGR